MMFNFIKCGILAAILFPQVCYAQFSSFSSFGNTYGSRPLRFYKCEEIGWVYTMFQPRFTTEYQTIEKGYNYAKDHNDVIITKHSESSTLRSKNPIGVIVDGFFILNKYNAKKALTLTAGLFMEQAEFKSQDGSPLRFSQIDEIDNFKISLWGAPVSLEFKSGFDANCDKFYKTTSSFGLGIMPYMALPAEVSTTAEYSIVPFVKAEFGFFAGVGFKFRAMYLLNSVTYANFNDEYSGNETLQKDLKSSLLLKTKPEFSISLIVLPGSYKWENTGGF